MVTEADTCGKHVLPRLYDAGWCDAHQAKAASDLPLKEPQLPQLAGKPQPSIPSLSLAPGQAICGHRCPPN